MFAGVLTGWSFKSIMSGNADFTSSYILWSLSIKSSYFIFMVFQDEWNSYILFGVYYPLYAIFCPAIYCLVTCKEQQAPARDAGTSWSRHLASTPDILGHVRWFLLFSFTVLLSDLPPKLGKHPFINYSCGNSDVE